MRNPRALVPLVVVGLVLGGCGGKPAPAAWAASVCAALAPWRTEIGSLTERAQKQMTAATTPAQAKENLVRLFEGAQTASETARTKVVAAGVPDADGGAGVAREFERSLAGARDAYRNARTTINSLGTGDAATFYNGVQAALATLTEEYGRSALDTTRLHSVELQRAFDEVPECR
jgi:predicted lipid-binding transport protein (Tim44 family)